MDFSLQHIASLERSNCSFPHTVNPPLLQGQQIPFKIYTLSGITTLKPVFEGVKPFLMNSFLCSKVFKYSVSQKYVHRVPVVYYSPHPLYVTYLKCSFNIIFPCFLFPRMKEALTFRLFCVLNSVGCSC